MTVERGNKLYDDGLTTHCSGRGNSGGFLLSAAHHRFGVVRPLPLSVSVDMTSDVKGVSEIFSVFITGAHCFMRSIGRGGARQR
jgi:hypothetical protein